MFEGQKDTYMKASNELHRTKGKLHELQVRATFIQECPLEKMK